MTPKLSRGTAELRAAELGTRAEQHEQDAQTWRAARRQLATVLIHGIDETATQLAHALLRLRIGTLLLRDRQLEGRAVGLMRSLRSAAGATLVALADPQADLRTVDLEVICGAGARELARTREDRSLWPEDSTGGSPHASVDTPPLVLPVEVTAVGATIGPAQHSTVLEASYGASLNTDHCVMCDAQASQGNTAGVTVGHGDGPEPDGLLAATAAAVTAHQIQMLIDGLRMPAVLQRRLHISAGTGELSSCTGVIARQTASAALVAPSP